MKLVDLADRETQERVLRCIEAAREGEQAPDPETPPHEKAVEPRLGAGQG